MPAPKKNGGGPTGFAGGPKHDWLVRAERSERGRSDIRVEDEVISGWLFKIVLGIAIAGFLVVELGSPVWTRAQLDGTAHDIADEAALEVRRTGSADVAKAAAERIAAERDVSLTAFEVSADQRVRVTVYRQARSYLLKRFDQTKDWYDVSVKADAVPPQN